MSAKQNRATSTCMESFKENWLTGESLIDSKNIWRVCVNHDFGCCYHWAEWLTSWFGFKYPVTCLICEDLASSVVLWWKGSLIESIHTLIGHFVFHCDFFWRIVFFTLVFFFLIILYRMFWWAWYTMSLKRSHHDILILPWSFEIKVFDVL